MADAYKWLPYDVPHIGAVAACLPKNMKWISPASQAQFPENQKQKHLAKAPASCDYWGRLKEIRPLLDVRPFKAPTSFSFMALTSPA